MKRIIVFLLFSFSAVWGSDIVIELLVTEGDNKIWQTENEMHMTIGHIKNVDVTKLMEAIDEFNRENCDFLQKSIKQGFGVAFFNTNGFDNGYHILEADPETTARFTLVNSKLYAFLIYQHLGTLSEKTTPKMINPKGYTPHIEFLEGSSEKIPTKGDILYFKNWRLQGRLLKN